MDKTFVLSHGVPVRGGITGLIPPFMGITERKKIVKTIRKLYDSLQSHLDYAVESVKTCESCGSRTFHAACVKDYAESIKDLADLL